MNAPSLGPMSGSSTEPFPLHDAKQAAREQRLVWVTYRDPGGQVTEGQVEIYPVTWKGRSVGGGLNQAMAVHLRAGSDSSLAKPG